MTKYEETLKRQAAMWCQKSRVNWLQHGDRNTSFFHASTISRRQRNKIFYLKLQNVKWSSDLDMIKENIVGFYQKLYTSKNPSSNDICSLVEPKLTASMVAAFNEPVLPVEVKTAIFQLGALSAPRPNGMSGIFYQHCWDIVGKDLVDAVISFFESGQMLKKMNHTHVVLIPKIPHLECIEQFRPIGLCNFSYKVIARAITNRMETILRTIIDDSQSAFVSNRLITDNILIAHEIMHFLKRKKKGKYAYMAMKLDMYKAYDRIEWPFVRKMLLALGFPDKWTNLIIECISTVTYSIKINGQVEGYIKPSRGLRQGDTLSMNLFILCAEGLSSIIHAARNARILEGIKMNCHCPPLSHLFFADDSFMFGRATLEEAVVYEALIEKYCLESR
ncbi:hypothetical protein AAC387_Pa07g3408 [Persea americana]